MYVAAPVPSCQRFSKQIFLVAWASEPKSWDADESGGALRFALEEFHQVGAPFLRRIASPVETPMSVRDLLSRR